MVKDSLAYYSIKRSSSKALHVLHHSPPSFSFTPLSLPLFLTLDAYLKKTPLPPLPTPHFLHPNLPPPPHPKTPLRIFKQPNPALKPLSFACLDCGGYGRKGQPLRLTHALMMAFFNEMIVGGEAG